MTAHLQNWTFDDTTAWLRPVDLCLAIELLRTTPSPPASHDRALRPAVLEIGVWKGAWLLPVTASSADVEGVGVDPYPGSPGMRLRVLQQAAATGLDGRLALVATRDDACRSQCGDGDGHRPFSLVHIDGLHGEDEVSDDLRYAAEHSCDHTVIVVDDYLHPAYPGVASAMYQFLAAGDHAMFLVTRNKAYLCRADQHADRVARTQRLLDEARLGWERHRGERSGARYVQPSDVMGFGVTLCLDPVNDERVLIGVRKPARVRARQQADRWVPPGARDVVRPVRNLLNDAAARSRPRR